MSAFVVSKSDIDAIVTVALEHELSTIPANTLGQTLWAENVASVAYRYGMPKRHRPEYEGYCEEVAAYAFEPLPLAPGAARKIVACYDYQACEHPAWEKSASKALTDKLQELLPEDDDYRKAPWGNIESAS